MQPRARATGPGSSRERRGGARIACALALALAAVDCAGSPRSRPTAAQPAHAAITPRSRQQPPSPATDGAEPVYAVLLPRLDAPTVVDREGATGYVLEGPLRAQLEGGGVVLAAQRLAAPVLAAARVEGGWVFAAEDGTVATSEEFAGPLRVLAGLATPVHAEQGAAGRLAVVDARGVAWTVADTRSIARVATPGGARVLSAAFGDARNGALVLEGGALVRTSDGGASLRPVDLGDEAAWQVESGGGRLDALTTAGVLRIAPDGATAAGSPPTHEVSLGEGAEARLLAATRQRYAPVYDRMATDVVAARDGSLLAADGRAVVVYDPLTGHERARHDDALPDSCTLLPWGDAVAARCYGTGLLRSDDDGESFVTVPHSEPAYLITLSDDGRHALTTLGCPAPRGARPRVGATTELAFCAYHDESRAWRAVPIAPAPKAFYGVHEAQILFSVGAAAGASDPRATSLAVVSAESGVVAPLRLDAAAPAGRVLAADFARDGTVYALAAGRDAVPVLWIGRPDAPLASRALPEGTTDVGFVDASRGVAAGTNASRIYRTLDGGRSWARVEPPVVGRAEDVALESGSVTCDRGAQRACRIGDAVVVFFGEGPAARLAREPVVVAPAPPAQPSDASAGGEPVPSLECHAGPRPAPPALSAGPVCAGCARVAFGGAGAHAELVFRSDPRRGLLARARWRADDGSLAGASRESPFATPGPVRDVDRARDAAYELAVVTPRGALVLRCPRGPGAVELICREHWAQSGGPIVPVEVAGHLWDLDRPALLTDAVARADGGVLLEYSVPRGDERVDEIVALDPRGEVVGRRAFAWPDNHERLRGLGRLGGDAGYFVSDPGRRDALWFYRLDRDPRASAERVPASLPGATLVAPCGASARPSTALRLRVPAGPSMRRIALATLPRRLDLRAELEQTASGTLCVREVVSWHNGRDASTRDDDASGSGLVLWARAGGAMVGSVDRQPGGARDALRCAVAP